MFSYTYPYRYVIQKLASALTPTIVILKHTYTVPHAGGYTHKHARMHAERERERINKNYFAQQNGGKKECSLVAAHSAKLPFEKQQQKGQRKWLS